ncbi:MAG TPA: Lrp/AsnC family transcriptional regulator [Chromobacteriaceae bacterium]|nr:Lrp/AsnC family transcriptional regulator [Chromobacteriaceae bacterium]
MDKYDRKILLALHANARMRFAELARQVNLSAPAVAERVEKLERAGVITGYHAAIDTARVGLPIRCLIELTVKNLEYYAVVEQIRNMPEVVECASITGSSGLMIRVAVDTMSSLQALIARLMQYGDTQTSIIIDMPVPARLPTLPEHD